MKAKSMSSYFK